MPNPDPSIETELAALAPLAEPVRRRLYLFVAATPGAVSRDDAAAALGITRALAAFHLDRLVQDGLLQTEYARRSGRTGPGAGRPAKLYRRTAEVHAVSLPARNYELPSELFATAITMADAGDAVARVRKDAQAYGRTLAERSRSSAADPAAPGSLETVLAEEGYEPTVEDGVIRLANCPFHALVAAHRDLTCGMNLALMRGLVEGLGAADWTPSLDPRPGRCCVAFRPASTGGDRPSGDPPSGTNH